MAAKPTRLFKYFSPERVSFLQDGLIRFTQPGDFNDPFEMRAPVTQLVSSTERDELIKREFKREMLKKLRLSKQYARLPAKRLELVATDFLNKAEPAIRLQIKAAHDGVVDVLNHELFVRALNNLIGVLCLSEVGNSPLMWGHYTSCYQGFAVEFDATHAFFQPPPDVHADVGALRPVKYVETRPTLSPTDDPSTDFLFSKAPDWHYESEWRLIRPLKTANATYPNKPFPIHLFEIPAEAIAAVIVGHRMNESVFDKLSSLLAVSSHRHIALRRIQMHEFRYDLTVEIATCWADLNFDETRAAVAKAVVTAAYSAK